MKLRNKKTGEIGEAGFISTSDGEIIVSNIKDEDKWYKYTTLEELNEHWEDALEGPKEYWYIGIDGEVYKKEHGYFSESQDNIGNRFEDTNECQDFYNKLLAWKRLKDKGFKISLKKKSNIGYLEANWQVLQGDYSDLDICFGDKE